MSLNNYYYHVLGDDLDDVIPLDEYIRLMLEKAKLRQKDMAEHLGMKAPQISRLCNGCKTNYNTGYKTGYKTSYKMLRRLANYFNEDIEFIIKMAIKADMV